MTTDRELELIVWGATGFTGRLVAEAARGLPDLRWGIGGRNRAKLEALHAELQLPEAVPILVADSLDQPALEALCPRTQVVITTVGPYAKYGGPLVAACAATGTHYVDITGEPHWIRSMIDQHHRAAQASGARIVHCCGFDSIPSDLGVWVLQQAALERHGVPCDEVRLVVRKAQGGFSGGTVASLLEAVRAVRNDPSVRKVLGNPYALNPPGERHGPDKNDPLRPQRGPDGAWHAPFVMAAINTRIVRRTNALLGFLYSRGFRYGEVVHAGRGARGAARAAAIAAGLTSFMTAASLKPTRALLERILPSPGEGPDREAREQGSFDLRLTGQGRTPDSRPFTIQVDVHGQRDPGYGATSRMLLAAALTQARDPVEVGGGSWTPASALAPHLVERLQTAGVTFTVADA